MNRVFDVSDHLAYLNDFMKKKYLKPQELKETKDNYSMARRKSKDKNLYLAVIGEFSRGKSTFINAILGEQLLPAKPSPTTAIPTFINYDNNFTMELDLLNGKSYSGTETRHRRLKSFVKQYSNGNKGMDSLRGILSEAAANNELSKELQQIKIGYQSDFVKNNIVIIDTPGLNSGFQEHAKAAFEIVKNTADIVVILTPAIQLLSGYLMKNLKQHAAPVLPRSVFVITMCDLAKKNPNELIKFARKRLKEELGLTRPIILPTSAQTILDEIENSNGNDNGSSATHKTKFRIWGPKFDQLKNKLDNYLVNSRSLSIAESLTRILDETYSTTKDSLSERKIDINRQIKRLEKNKIRDLKEYSEESMVQTLQDIKEDAKLSRKKIKPFLANLKSELKTNVENAIYDVESGTIEEFNKLKSKIRSIYNKSNEEFRKYSYELINDVLSEYNKNVESIKRRFNKEYQKIKLPGIEIPKLLSPWEIWCEDEDPDFDTWYASDIGHHIRKVDNRKSAERAGIASYLLVGLPVMVLGPIGLILGIASGAGAGAIVAKNYTKIKLRLTYKKILREIEKDMEYSIDASIEEAKASFNNSVKTVEKRLRSELKMWVEIFVDDYSKVVEKSVKDLELKLENLSKKDEGIKDELKLMSLRKRRLQTKINRFRGQFN